jgi:hypothetical protein
MEALDALSRCKCTLLEEGIERAKELFTYMFQFVRNSITMGLIHSAGPFLYLTVQEVTHFYTFSFLKLKKKNVFTAPIDE